MSIDSDEIRVTRATLARQVEDAIRRDILRGTLEPGHRLRTAELSKRYGVSATPLREALQRLAANGLVDWDPRLGAAVADVSLSEVQDTYAVRALLECRALEMAIAEGSEEWASRVTERWTQFRATTRPSRDAAAADALLWSRTHRAFHDALLEACGSPWLLRFAAILQDHSERYQMLSARIGTRDPHKEHETIFNAVIGRDTPAAVTALRDHLTATVQVVEAGMLGDRGPHHLLEDPARAGR